jgi:predicted dehydrogenase
VDWHCHNVDVACWAKGAWPVSAQAFGGRTYPEAGNLFDHYSVEFTFADGTKLFAYSRHMAGCWQTYSDYAHGTKGSARIMANLGDPDPCIYKSHVMEDSNIAWRYGQKDFNPYHAEWQALLDAIRQGKRHNEARRAGEADLAALMGQMAAHSGQMLTWDQVMKSEFQQVKDVDHMTLDTPAPILAGPDGLYAAPMPGKSKEI